MTDFVRARSEDLEWRAVDDQLVLLDLRTQRYLSLNKTGTALWPLIVEGAPRGALVTFLVDRYGVDEGVASDSLDALIAQLTEAGLLQGESNAPAQPQ